MSSLADDDGLIFSDNLFRKMPVTCVIFSCIAIRALAVGSPLYGASPHVPADPIVCFVDFPLTVDDVHGDGMGVVGVVQIVKTTVEIPADLSCPADVA